MLLHVPGVAPHYQIVVTRTGTLDELEVRAEVSEELFRQGTSNVRAQEAIEDDATMRELRVTIQQAIKSTLGLTTRVTLAVPGAIPRSEGGKLKRTLDLRQL